MKLLTNTFNLRFRQKKLLAVLGLILGMLVMPMAMQITKAAGTVNLDMDQAVRLVTGPGSPTEFGSEDKVQHGNVAQFSTIVHNTENANSDRVAENFKMKLSVPKGPTTSALSKASVSASNDASNSLFKTSDTTTLNSANGQPFSLTKPRDFKIQRNTIAKDDCNKAELKFDQGADLPSSRIKFTETATSYDFTIDPNGDGKLKPSFCDALRIVFLTDVTQTIPGPHITIEKKVKNEGSTTFVDENTAKAGETLTYVVRVANTGQSTAHNVVIRDSLPPLSSVEYLTGSCQYNTSGNNTLRPCPDNFVNGGVIFTDAPPNSVSYFYIKVKVKDSNCKPDWFTNTAGVKTNETPEAFDVVKTTLIVPVSKLKIFKFEDLNGNKDQDAGEKPMAGVSFTVTGPSFSKTEKTDASGLIIFSSINPGEYTATETVPTDFEVTTPNPQKETVVCGQTALLTFGDKPKPKPQIGKLKILKFEDTNGNGQQGSGESPLANVSFRITGPNGFDQTKLTDQNGEILLTDLEPGTYTVLETVPSGFKPTTLTTQQAVVVVEQTTTLKFGNQKLSTPTPTPTPPTPTPTPPTPTPPGPPETPGGPKGGLPVTGASALAMLGTIALATSLYYYLRERRALDRAIRNQKIEQ